MRNLDTLVVGAGVMGASISYNLATRGEKVLCVEQFYMNHQKGSSHGKSRIIRTAYFEDPIYVPLVKRSWKLWFDLQEKSRTKILQVTGGIQIGLPTSPLILGARKSADEHHLEIEQLDANEISGRFRALKPTEEEVGIYEKEAGVLFPERCIESFVSEARSNGAEFRFGTSVSKWESRGDTIVVRLSSGEELVPNSMILSSGPWLSGLVPELKLPLLCEKQMVFWFDQGREILEPIFIWEEGGEAFYGIPDIGGDGIKIARHHGGEIAKDPRSFSTSVDHEKPILEFQKKRLSLGAIKESMSCIYTNTPDSRFIIDKHPLNQNVFLVSACSGHGFKFASVIGEIVASLALGRKIEYDISPFSLSRFLARDQLPQKTKEKS